MAEPDTGVESEDKIFEAAVQHLAEKQVRDMSNPILNIAGGINKEVISLAGAPMDIANKMSGLVGAGLKRIGIDQSFFGEQEKPIGGSERLIEEGRNLGFVNQAVLDETPSARIGNTAGIGMTFLAGMLGTMGKAATLEQVSSKVGEIFVTKGKLLPFSKGSKLPVDKISTATKAKQLFDPIIATFQKSPKGFAAAEGVSIMGASVAREVGGQSFGEDSLGQVLSELAGGIAAPTVLIASGKLPVVSMLRKISGNFIKGAEQKNAAKSLQKGVTSPEEIVKQIGKLETLPGVKLTAGQTSGSQELLDLESAVAKKVPELAEEMVGNEAAANQTIRNALEDVAPGSIDNTKLFFEAKKVRLFTALNARLAGAMTRFSERIENLKPKLTRENVSKGINDELEDALSDARVQENAVWDPLPDDEIVPILKSTFDEFIGDESNIPGFVASFFKSKKLSTKKFKDVKEFRSKIGRAQKTARAQGDAEQAFLLQKVNEGILDDITNSNLGPDFDLAVSFSRELNKRFTQGAVGEVMRFASRGGRAVPAELVSESLIPPSNVPKAAAGVRATRKAGEALPDTPPRTEQQLRLEEDMEDLIRTRLFSKGETFDTKKAKTFLTRNRELLDQFPQLKASIQDAVSRSGAVDVLKARIKNAKSSYLNKQRTAATLILGTRPAAEMRTLLNRPNRRRLLTQAVNAAKKDTDAMAGIQNAYMEEFMRVSLTSQRDIKGKKLFSSELMRNFMKRTIQDVRSSKLLDGKQIVAINKIIKNVEALERKGRLTPKATQAVSSATSMMEDFLVKVLGARLGARFAGGFGASLIAAQTGSSMARRVVEKLPGEKAMRVIYEAVRNEELMKDLLLKPTTPAMQVAVTKRLNAWLAGMGIETMEIESGDNQETKR